MTKLGVVLILFCAWAGTASAESLYSPSRYAPLISDHRARDVGDALTIVVVEAASAESRADTSSGSGFSVDAGLTDASGLAKAGVSVDTDSTGTGRTARTGSVTAQLSVKVEQKLESGNLRVKGSQLITINGEQQRINLEGVVRPVDISADNAVLSTRLMDARIEYAGQGWVARNQQPGLFARLLHFIGF
ncbi:MAG: flagellar basal body L-ring protein FlgH [Hypericibacter sp.]